MHMARTGRNLGLNCTDFNNHIHLISVDVNNEKILRIIFSQKIYGYPVRIFEELIALLDRSENHIEFDEYLINNHFTLNNIRAHGEARNKYYFFNKDTSGEDIESYLYKHSIIGDRIRQLLDSGQLRI